MPDFIGRNWRCYFQLERLRGKEALNEVLRPYPQCCSGSPPAVIICVMAGRCASSASSVTIPACVSQLSITLADNNELSMMLDLEPQRVLYPLASYPVIREFATMLRVLKPGEQWLAREFFGYTGKGPTAFNFPGRRNSIVVAFSVEEWGALGELMYKALGLPELQEALKGSELAYGEI
jgi:hypothetical protein